MVAWVTVRLYRAKEAAQYKLTCMYRQEEGWRDYEKISSNNARSSNDDRITCRLR